MNILEPFSDQLIFESLIPGVEIIMPIIEAKEFKHEWLEKAREDFRSQRKNENYKYEKNHHTAKCPGIIDITRTGWVLKTWQDTVIETNGDLQSFSWESPVDQKQFTSLAPEAIDYHSQETYFKFKNNFSENTLKTIIKFVTPWRMIIPKGYKILAIPIPYIDENRFTVLPGIFSFGIAPCNVQTLWHVTNGKTLIKAGTPLIQYILIPESQPTAIVRQMEDSTLYDAYVLNFSNKFSNKY